MKSEYIRFVAATKPCDSIYLKFIPLDKKLTIRAMVVVEEFIKNNLIPSMLEIDSLWYFVFQYLLRWRILRRFADQGSNRV